MDDVRMSSGFCNVCGDTLQWMAAEHALACANVQCPNSDPTERRFSLSRQSARDEWQGHLDRIKAGPPIRMPTREELLADARRGSWRDITTLKFPMAQQSVLITRECPNGGWLIRRLHQGEGIPYIHGRPASHWAEDTIGTPAS